MTFVARYVDLRVLQSKYMLLRSLSGTDFKYVSFGVQSSVAAAATHTEQARRKERVLRQAIDVRVRSTVVALR